MLKAMSVEEALIVLDTVPEAYVRLDSKCHCTYANQAVDQFSARLGTNSSAKSSKSFVRQAPARRLKMPAAAL